MTSKPCMAKPDSGNATAKRHAIYITLAAAVTCHSDNIFTYFILLWHNYTSAYQHCVHAITELHLATLASFITIL